MKLRIDVEVQVEVSEMKRLKQHLDEEKVQGFCSRCHNYGGNYSCPDFDFNTEEMISPYDNVAVIMTRIDTEPLKKVLDRIQMKDITSSVYEKYTKRDDYPGENIISALAMYAFGQIKDAVSDRLLELEAVTSGFSVPPGTCERCNRCIKQAGKPCVYPEKLRYSLEALGFLVSDVYRDYFDLELEFARGEMPGNYYTCSAVFSKKEMDAALIEKALEGMRLEVEVNG